MGQRRRASVVCMDGGELLAVCMRDPVSGVTYRFPPGGAIEPGETPAEAAAREALEETGYAVRVLPESERVARYPFTWAGVNNAVTTHFFAGILPAGRRGQLAHVRDAVHLGVEWLPIERVVDVLGFEPAILDPVRELMGWLAGRGVST